MQRLLPFLHGEKVLRRDVGIADRLAMRVADAAPDKTLFGLEADDAGARAPVEHALDLRHHLRPDAVALEEERVWVFRGVLSRGDGLNWVWRKVHCGQKPLSMIWRFG